MGKWDAQRHEVWQAAQDLERMGLVSYASGNVSLRLPSDGDRMLLAITPTQVPYARLRPEDIVVIDSEGEPIEGELLPSSETPMHVGIYHARPDVRAVIHTHSVYASVCAVSGRDIPPIIDEMVFFVGGPVKLAEYGFPGTEELAQNVAAALGPRNAALIRNHGVLGVGKDLGKALEVCALVERVAHVFVFASLLGRVEPIPIQALTAEEELFLMRRQAENEQEKRQ